MRVARLHNSSIHSFRPSLWHRLNSIDCMKPGLTPCPKLDITGPPVDLRHLPFRADMDLLAVVTCIQNITRSQMSQAKVHLVVCSTMK